MVIRSNRSKRTFDRCRQDLRKFVENYCVNNNVRDRNFNIVVKDNAFSDYARDTAVNDVGSTSLRQFEIRISKF